LFGVTQNHLDYQHLKTELANVLAASEACLVRISKIAGKENETVSK